MKRIRQLPAIFILFLVLFLLNISQVSYSQDEIALASIPEDEITIELPKATLKTIVMDTVLPTICNEGLGLIHIDRVCLPEEKKDNRSAIKGERLSTVISLEGFTESEILEFEEHQRQLNEKHQYEQEKQWIQENLWIDLEGIIRGINTPPLF